MKINDEERAIRFLYRKSAKLNLYVSTFGTNDDRVKNELQELKELVTQLITFIENKEERA